MSSDFKPDRCQFRGPGGSGPGIRPEVRDPTTGAAKRANGLLELVRRCSTRGWQV